MRSTLTKHQQASFSEIDDFIKGGRGSRFILEGYAGTGKSHLCKEICLQNQARINEFLFTSPTNKATKILGSFLGEYDAKCATIYSALGITMVDSDNSGELKLKYPKNPLPLKGIKTVMVDECSMINTELMQYLDMHYYRTRVLFIGDSLQLPPVGEPTCPAFAQKGVRRTILTEVVRHDGRVLQLATKIRQCIADGNTSLPRIQSDFTEEEGVHVVGRRKFDGIIKLFAESGHFRHSSAVKVVAWTNRTVNKYNDYIRRCQGAKEDWEEGDVIMVASPVVSGDVTLLTIDDEGVIMSREHGTHPVHTNLRCLRLKVQFDIGSHTLYLISPESEGELQRMLAEKAAIAKRPKCGHLWKNFWELKNSFHSIRYAYAITAHRAQGSTYESVMVDSEDILQNRNWNEALRCLYVAVTRATNHVILV